MMPWEVGKVLLQIQWVPREPEGKEMDGERLVEEDEVCTHVFGSSGSDFLMRRSS